MKKWAVTAAYLEVSVLHKKLSKAQLAKRMKVSVQFLDRVLRGDVPLSPRIAAKLQGEGLGEIGCFAVAHSHDAKEIYFKEAQKCLAKKRK